MSAQLKRWDSTSGSGFGLEVEGLAVAPAEIEHRLRLLSRDDARRGSFLVLRLVSTDRAGLQAAIRAAAEVPWNKRICLALDRATLSCIDGTLPVAERVGLLLDGVDAGTPLADLVAEHIEAVRFRPDFLDRASCSLRIDAALRALTSLARDLGLATFGRPGQATAGEGAPRFDYVNATIPVSVNPSGAARFAAMLPHRNERMQRL